MKEFDVIKNIKLESVVLESKVIVWIIYFIYNSLLQYLSDVWKAILHAMVLLDLHEISVI